MKKSVLWFIAYFVIGYAIAMYNIVNYPQSCYYDFKNDEICRERDRLEVSLHTIAIMVYWPLYVVGESAVLVKENFAKND